MTSPTAPRPHYVFVYGTLADAERLNMLLAPRIYDDPMPVAVLPAFRREECQYFYATPDADARIEGKLIGPFTDAELAQLDRYEGCPVLYSRQKEVVTQEGVGHFTAWVYVGERIRENHEAHQQGRGGPCWKR